MGFKTVTDKFIWKNIVFTHMPAKISLNQINIHGHLHEELIYINVDCQNHANIWDREMKPIRLRDVLERLKSGYYKGITINDEEDLDNHCKEKYFNEGTLESSNDNDLTKFSWYHLELDKEGFNPKKCSTGWDEELYCKSIDDSIRAVGYTIRNMEDSKTSGYLWTATLDENGIHPIYLGKIAIYRTNNEEWFNWEWEEQEYLGDKEIDIIIKSQEDQTVTESFGFLHSIMESSDKSKLDKYFKKKIGKDFKYIDIKTNKSKVEKYLSDDKTYNNTYKKHINEISGEIVIDENNDTLVGYVFIIDKFITPVFVNVKYRGYGVGDKLVHDAVNKYGAKRLWVFKDNEVAIKIYKKYGFKIYIEDDKPSILMATDKKYADEIKSAINEISMVIESCKNLNDARKLCIEVQRIAKKYNANFFFVTDGASAYSNGNNGYNNAAKEMRSHMDKWEKKNGFNPDDDWSNNVNDTSNYRLAESYIMETKRSNLPDDMFGIPEERKYPLDTKKHVYSAVKLFNHVSPQYEEKLARNIINKINEYGITDINPGENNRFSKYYKPNNV